MQYCVIVFCPRLCALAYTLTQPTSLTQPPVLPAPLPPTPRGVAFTRYLWRTACIWLAAACRSTTQPAYPNPMSISKVVSCSISTLLWSVSIISWKCPNWNPLRQQVAHKGNSQISCYKSSNLAVRALGIQYIIYIRTNSRLYWLVNKARTNDVICPAIGYEMGPPSTAVRSDPLNNAPQPKEKSLKLVILSFFSLASLSPLMPFLVVEISANNRR